MIVNSPYTKIGTSKDVLLNVGYNYEGKVLKNVMSKQMFRTNETMLTFLTYIDSIVYEIIENVKRIKTFGNPALDKNERRLI